MRKVRRFIGGLRGRVTASRGTLISILLSAAGVAHAGCMTAPTQELQSLAELAGRNPSAVLTATSGDEANRMDSLRFGWRQAARAEAYDTLSRPGDARRVAMRMIERDRTSQTPLHVELLTRYAMNGFGSEELDQAIPAVKAARRRQVHGTPADACLQIALGEMERIGGAPERAVVYLADAYRASLGARMKQPHVVATEKLSRVINWAGDHLQAISLIEEVIEWDQARGRVVALSTDFYLRGSFNLARGAYSAALADFRRSREFAPAGIDPVGAGFLDLQTCATLIELQMANQAKALCRRADTIFLKYDGIAGGQAQMLLARIAIMQSQPQVALSFLNGVLAKDDVLASFASASEAYRLRADVNRRLGRTDAAYADLDVYVRGTERQRRSERARQSAVLRASFDADRAAARNRELQQMLDFSNERGREQASRYTVLALSAAIGVVLLFVIAGMAIYHRRKLTRIANTDPLTGLFNRRFVNAHEKTLIGDHPRAGEALALALIDIDHFKAINDAYGHSAGDEVLIAFAGLARRVLRNGDVIARWGGEEFIVFFPRTTEGEAAATLERLRSALTEGIATMGGLIPVRFSAGVASFLGSEGLQSLVRRADAALYRAKGAGRNCVEMANAQNLWQSDNHTAPSPPEEMATAEVPS